MEERRQANRHAVRLAAEVRVGSARFGARAMDLSLTGVGLNLTRPIAENTAVTLSLFLVVGEFEDAETAPVELSGKIVWIAETDEGGVRAGVHFESLTPKQKASLEHYLERL